MRILRTSWHTVGVLIFSLMVVLAVAGPSTLAAAVADPERGFWLNRLSEEYGLPKGEIQGLRESGMEWPDIASYLELLYPHPPIELRTEDFVELARRTDITPIEAMRAFELGVFLEIDPAWLAGLYKQSGGWEKVEDAFKRYEEAKDRAYTLAVSGQGRPTQESVIGVLSPVYRVSGLLLRQLMDAGMDEQTLMDYLLFLDASSADERWKDVTNHTPLPGNWRELLPDLTPIRSQWPRRQFPANLRPLGPSVQKASGVQGGGMDLNLRFPETKLSQTPSASADLGVDAQENVVRPADSGSSPPPSMVDPSSLYNSKRVSPFKSYFDGYSERIDPSSGALMIKQTDFTLPGRNGLDFSFTRIYNSQQSNYLLPRVGTTVDHYDIQAGTRTWYGTPDTSTFTDSYGTWTNYYTYRYDFTYAAQTSTNGQAYGVYQLTTTVKRDLNGVYHHTETYYSYNSGYNSPLPWHVTTVYRAVGSLSDRTYPDRRYGLGLGWSLAFPTLEMTDNKIYLHREDGGTYEVKGTGATGYSINGYEPRDLEFGASTAYSNGQMTSSYALRRKDGLIWYFGNDGRLLGIKDRFGNEIKFEHTVIDGLARIQRAWDTVGRKIEFVYDLTASQVTVSVYASAGSPVPELTWSYLVPQASYSGKRKLAEVIPPGNELHTRYEYANDSSWFTPWVSGAMAGSTVYGLYYLDLVAVYHPTGANSRFAYGGASKDLDNDDPSTNTASSLYYYRVTSRYDEVPTTTASSSGQAFETKISGKSSFSYGAWESSNSRYVTTRTPARTTGEAGDAPATELWEFNKEHQITAHETSGGNTGADRLQTEKVRTQYTYFAKLPLQETVTTTVGGATRPNEVSTSKWDSAANIMSRTDPTGRTVEYTYDERYGLLLSQMELTATTGTTKEGRLVEYVLDSDKRVVLEQRGALARDSQAGSTTYTGPTVTSIGENTPRIWLVPGPVTSANLQIRYSSTYSATLKFKVEYRDIGSGTWTTVVDRSYYTSGTKTEAVPISFPQLSMYEIRVTISRSRTDAAIGVSSASATGPVYNREYLSPLSRQSFSYDLAFPGNLTTARILSSDGLAELSRTDYTYDALKHAYPERANTTVTKATGGTSTISTVAAYDALGRIISYRVEDGTSASENSYTYDKLNRLLSMTLPPKHASEARPSRTRQYLDSQRQVVLTDERGKQSRETYDGLGRFVLAEWRDDVGNWRVAAHSRYDSLGRVVSDFDALFNETKYEYDGFGRKTKTIYPVPAGQPSVFEQAWYVDAGSSLWPLLPKPTTSDPTVRWEKVEDGRTETEAASPTYRGYDVAGRLVWVASNPRNGNLDWDTVWYEYDTLNRPTRVYVSRAATDQWDVTAYAYSTPFDQPTSMDLPGTTEPIHTYEYDNRGLKTAEDRWTADQILLEYDELGRVKVATYPNNVLTRFVYDKDGRIVEAQLLENGYLTNKVTMQYNLRGWLEQESWQIDGVTYSINYGYDDAGNRTSMTYPNGAAISFEYDELGRLRRIPGLFENPSQPNYAGFVYNENGVLTSMRSMNGVETTYTPDVRNRLKSLASAPLNLTYNYSSAGNVSSIVDGSGGTPVNLNYGYDGANRLTSAQVNLPGGLQTVTYQYDGAGNRLMETWTDARGAIQYQYLSGNYLQSRGGAAGTQYAWGSYGQLESKQEGSALTDYVYDPRRLMTQVTVNGGEVARFFYDALGRRVKAVEADITTITLFSGNDIVYEVKSPASVPTVTTRYLALDGKYLAKTVQEGANQPQAFFYHTDMVGSVRALTDASGQVVARFEYEPFGTTTQAIGTGETHKFAGKSEITGIGLYYFGARHYDSSVGRFTSADPIGDGLNWYDYGSSNPLRFVDPTGLRVEDSYAVFDPGVGGGTPDFRPKTQNYQDRNTLYAKSFWMDLMPIFGDAKGLAEFFTGRDAFTDEELTWWERALGLVLFTELRSLIKAGKIATVGGKLGFKSSRLWLEHWARHMDEFPELKNPVEYLERARWLFSQKPSADLLTYTRRTGARVVYRKSTNEFAIQEVDGTIVTLFKPTRGYQYYVKDMRKWK